MNRIDPNIDELLNSYIDGELTETQQMEVRRLIADDEQIARRLRDLQKCKILVGCLPHAQVPTEIFSSLAARPSSLVARRPLRRRLLTVAATIALIAVLTAVIHSIFVPEDTQDKPTRPPFLSSTEATGAARFGGKLELTTSTLTAVDAFINRAIRDNDLSDCIHTTSLGDRMVYSFDGSRHGLNLFLAELSRIWERFDSATLMVETARFGEHVVVNGVAAEQVAQIVEQEDRDKAIRMAEDFAVLNDMAQLLPGKEMLAAAGDKKPSLITIPKPVLTGPGESVKNLTPAGADTKEVQLTSVVRVSKVLRP